MIDIECSFDSFKAFWFKRLSVGEDPNENWAQILLHYFNRFGSLRLIMNAKVDRKCANELFKTLPCFWQEVVILLL